MVRGIEPGETAVRGADGGIPDGGRRGSRLPGPGPGDGGVRLRAGGGGTVPWDGGPVCQRADGGLVRGWSLAEAAGLAADFVSRCAQRTREEDTPRREGVDFEPLLWRLGQRMEEEPCRN